MTGSPTRSTFYSLLLHAAAIALILFATTGTNPPIALVRPMLLAARDLVFLPPAPDHGGGGGQNQAAPPQLGRLPRPALRVFTPPVIEIRNLDPRLPVEPTILAPPDAPMPVVNVDQWGDPTGIFGTKSGGPGTNGGIGTGAGGGDGPGHGPGAGPGNNSGVGSPDTQGGRGIFTAPVLLFKTEPAYSEEARKGKVQGTVISSRRDRRQRPPAQHPRPPAARLRPGGTRRRRCWPLALPPRFRNGKPVPCTAEVEVNFRLL
jgi:periplasmic protein TonB